MSAIAGIGFNLMLIALAIMLTAVPRRRVAHLGFLFLAVTFMYHFIGEVAQSLFPGRNVYREYVDQSAVDPWLVIAGAAMLAFSVAYALTLGKRSAKVPGPADMAGRWPRWQTLLAIAAPMWLLLPACNA